MSGKSSGLNGLFNVSGDFGRAFNCPANTLIDIKYDCHDGKKAYYIRHRSNEKNRAIH